MKTTKRFPPLFRVLGVLALLAGLYLMGESVAQYVTQCQQADWPTTSASVTDCSSRVIRSGGRRHSHSRTVYDVTYQYQVNGERYTGRGTGQAAPRLVGDSLSVKYDPECPNRSTTVLTPQISDLVIPFGGGVLFCVLGVWASGLVGRIRKREVSNASEETQGTLPEVRRKGFPWWKGVLLALFWIGGMVLALTLGGEKTTSPAERFQTILEQQGYSVTDTTESLRQNWNLSSLLVEAYSAEGTGIQMDYCVMDSADSAKRLYAGMTLPLSEGVERSGSCWVSKENETVYVTKRYADHTVLYGAAEIGRKTELLELLDLIGYGASSCSSVRNAPFVASEWLARRGSFCDQIENRT